MEKIRYKNTELQEKLLHQKNFVIRKKSFFTKTSFVWKKFFCIETTRLRERYFAAVFMRKKTWQILGEKLKKPLSQTDLSLLSVGVNKLTDEDLENSQL